MRLTQVWTRGGGQRRYGFVLSPGVVRLVVAVPRVSWFTKAFFPTFTLKGVGFVVGEGGLESVRQTFGLLRYY